MGTLAVWNGFVHIATLYWRKERRLIGARHVEAR
jgi:hypothetical protein